MDVQQVIGLLEFAAFVEEIAQGGTGEAGGEGTFPGLRARQPQRVRKWSSAWVMSSCSRAAMPARQWLYMTLNAPVTYRKYGMPHSCHSRARSNSNRWSAAKAPAFEAAHSTHGSSESARDLTASIRVSKPRTRSAKHDFTPRISDASGMRSDIGCPGIAFGSSRAETKLSAVCSSVWAAHQHRRPGQCDLQGRMCRGVPWRQLGRRLRNRPLGILDLRGRYLVLRQAQSSADYRAVGMAGFFPDFCRIVEISTSTTPMASHTAMVSSLGPTPWPSK